MEKADHFLTVSVLHCAIYQDMLGVLDDRAAKPAARIGMESILWRNELRFV